MTIDFILHLTPILRQSRLPGGSPKDLLAWGRALRTDTSLWSSLFSTPTNFFFYIDYFKVEIIHGNTTKQNLYLPAEPTQSIRSASLWRTQYETF